MLRAEKERPIRNKDDWDRFMRERKRAEYAISNKEFFGYVAKFFVLFVVAMLIRHLRGLL
jgi:hypothetical protein